jgi:hypothetical protein
MNLSRMIKANACPAFHRIGEMQLDKSIERHLFELLQRIDYTLYRLDNIIKIEQMLLEPYKTHYTKAPGSPFVLAIGNVMNAPFQYEICDCISGIRLIQDATMRVIEASYKAGVPHSMSDYCKKIKKSQYNKLPKTISVLIKAYWDTNGERIKKYRDVLTHHEILVNRITLKGDGQIVYLDCPLPDNPETKSPSKFVYSNCNAIDYCQSETKIVLKFVNEVFVELCHYLHAPESERLVLEYFSPSVPQNVGGLIMDCFKTSIVKKGV